MLETLTTTMREFYRVEAPASPGGRVLELDGVTAFLTPSAPTQSIVNCVLFDRHDALQAALPQLADAYAAERITHWMVWTLPGDEQGPRLLEAAGHMREYEPMAMALELDELARAGARRRPRRSSSTATPTRSRSRSSTSAPTASCRAPSGPPSPASTTAASSAGWRASTAARPPAW